jgi:hypothetical protein
MFPELLAAGRRAVDHLVLRAGERFGAGRQVADVGRGAEPAHVETTDGAHARVFDLGSMLRVGKFHRVAISQSSISPAAKYFYLIVGETLFVYKELRKKVLLKSFK